jgi:short chain dehydrogenase
MRRYFFVFLGFFFSFRMLVPLAIGSPPLIGAPMIVDGAGERMKRSLHHRQEKMVPRNAPAASAIPSWEKSGEKGALMFQKVWMITGASRGLGAEIARAVLAEGDQLVATGRESHGLAQLGHRAGLLTLAVDVTDEPQVRAAVGAALD